MTHAPIITILLLSDKTSYCSIKLLEDPKFATFGQAVVLLFFVSIYKMENLQIFFCYHQRFQAQLR